MKIRHVVIKNFKAIREFEYSFVDELSGKVRPITLIFGDNGSGKTSVLQAIALAISLATLKTTHLSLFKWPGFLSDRIGSLGEPYIKVELALEAEEIDGVHEAYSIWNSLSPAGLSKNISDVAPARDPILTIEFKQGHVEVQGGKAKARELLGRYFTKEVVAKTSQYSTLLNKTGEVFWFDQYRNLGELIQEKKSLEDTSSDWGTGISNLREYLIQGWMAYKVAKIPSEDNFIVQLEKKFSQIFHGAKFAGIEKKQTLSMAPTMQDWYFLIERDHTSYDISEMSSGEQAVFAILFDFVTLGISRSIVLIDELELHLHPPEQQALFNSLRKIGPDCQFIITSHSPYLRDITLDKNKVRLKGGRLCL